jgi:tRNA 5-methylaminomethyl-2-thiouridine biosynthesis bifunctional protein
MSSESAQLAWHDGQPYSLQYGDVYFSSVSGLEETQHVFLQHNRLQERWQALNSGDHFTVAETGFGTGLNFLCAWQLWNACAPAGTRLHFVSVEKYPLSAADLAQALNLWTQLQHEREQLLSQYAELAPGWHRLVFEDGHVTLTLIVGDVLSTLPQLRASVDAWFLDGFAPAKNPDMWQPGLFEQMARLSHDATTFATFTSAGAVKRGLLVPGFEVNKVAGFGRKREMLCGTYRGDKQRAVAAKTRQAIVIGGGIAGTATSHALASRGWQVTLIERNAGIASEASGNPLGVLYPRLSGQDIVLSRLAQHGYLHTLRLLQRLHLGSTTHDACGLLQLAFDEKEVIRCKAVAKRGLPAELVRYVDAAEASMLAGVTLTHGGLYFPAAGWVHPPGLCQALTVHPNISIRTSTSALQLQRHSDLWHVCDAAGTLVVAPVVVVAAASASMQFNQTAHLPLESVRGQLSFVEQTIESGRLKTIVCTDGYVSPAVHGQHCIGATFTPDDSSAEVRETDHAANLARLADISSELHAALHNRPAQGRVAFRSVTPDYLPVVGPVLDATLVTEKPPRPNADPATLPWLPGLYVNAGHGSKGLINAPFCAEMLASAIAGEPLPADAQLLAALDPNRFLLRQLGLKKLVQGLAVHPLL